MPNAQSSSAGKLVWAAFLACCLHASLLVLADESVMNPKSVDDNPQADLEMSKKDWNKQLKLWGKRGWNNLHGGWGLKRSAPSWQDEPYSPPVVEKRAWSSLQSGWGKRLSPEDEYAMQQLATMIHEEEAQPQYTEYGPENDFEINDDEKRNWAKFNEGWGKRSKWEKFRGAWGKRDPAWSNLKGIWGKRSYLD